MLHLINDSVYASESDRIGPFAGCDGIELLTGYETVDPRIYGEAVSAHLPYCTDWYSVWTGRIDVPEDISDIDARYIFYGRNREDIIDSVRRFIEAASPLEPAYGVIHAGSAKFDELISNSYSESDSIVLSAFAEMMNSAVSVFPNGEPPFRILFENQWWPGLRMLDGSGHRMLVNSLEFENWGLCLDTGHILVATHRSENEIQAAELLLDVFDGYPEDMIDDIVTVHLHVNTSAEYIRSHKGDPMFGERPFMERLRMGYKHVCSMDTHRPFSVAEARDLADRLSPDFVTHEMGAVNADDRVKDYLIQRSLFP